MNLLDVVSSLDRLSDELFIGVRQPWTETSECLLVPFSQDFRFPSEASAQGFEYFLELPTAKEVREVFAGRFVTASQVAQLLIHYAENDAYPEWAYDA
jgi:hypothetical protein